MISTERLEEMRHLAEKQKQFAERFPGLEAIRERAAEQVELLTELIGHRRTHERLVQSTKMQHFTTDERVV